MSRRRSSGGDQLVLNIPPLEIVPLQVSRPFFGKADKINSSGVTVLSMIHGALHKNIDHSENM